MRMNPISFLVNGDPKGQPRPRAFAINGTARVYNPATAEAWKNQIAVGWKQNKPSAFIQAGNPIRLTLRFYMLRPKSHFKKAGLRDDAPIFCEKKPDCDNLAKAVMDALTVLQVWRDDSQVCQLHVEKIYSETPGVWIVIEECGQVRFPGD